MVELPPVQHGRAPRLRIKDFCKRSVAHRQDLVIDRSWLQSLLYAILMFVVPELCSHHRAFPHAFHWVQPSLAPCKDNVFYEIFRRDSDQREIPRIGHTTLGEMPQQARSECADAYASCGATGYLFSAFSLSRSLQASVA